MLYPLIFDSIFKERLWGGRNLERLYGKSLPPGLTIGESWEIADLPDGVSIIANGPLAGRDLRWLVEQHQADLLGSATLQNGRFPLLVKLLDAEQTLSLQVHPPASVAARLGGEAKTEVWYVADAREGAELMAGLKKDTVKELFKTRLSAGLVEACLHRLPVRAGDALFLPSGRVHAIGAGNVVFEIQQTSDTTYRLYDWNRRELNGKPRELHAKQALDSIDFQDWEPQLVAAAWENRRGTLCRWLADEPLFAVEECRAPPGELLPFYKTDKPVIIGLVTGILTIEHPQTGTQVRLTPGRFCLLPACLEDLHVTPNSAVTYLRAEPGEAGQTLEIPDQGPEHRGVPLWQQRRRHHRRRHRRRHRQSSFDELLDEPLTLERLSRVLFPAGGPPLALWALLLAVLGLALLLPPMWKVTPEGVEPGIRLSLLNKTRASMLGRAATKAAARGDLAEAAQTWEKAVARNPADSGLLRGQIRNALRMPASDLKVAGSVVANARWLLRLTRTNRTDLELVVQLHEKLGLQDSICQALRTETDLSPALQAAYMKALFQCGEVSEFSTRWQRMPQALRDQPALALLQAAYLAGWGPAGTAGEGRSKLVAAMNGSSDDALLAHRLELLVAARQNDISAYASSLRWIEQRRQDSVRDHARYWRMLLAAGKKQEAVEAARLYSYPLRTPGEVCELAAVNEVLGLHQEAVQIMERYAPQFPQDEFLATNHALLLLRGQHWEQLDSLALRVRQQKGGSPGIESYGFYLEGRAELAKGRPEAARAAFDEAARIGFANPGLGHAVAVEMTELGYPATARTILARLESALASRQDYWRSAWDCALRVKDPDLLLKAANALCDAEPANALYGARLGAALLVTRQQPEKALRLAAAARDKSPNSVKALLDYCHALLLNRRVDEADAQLATVDPAALDKEEASSYHMARFAVLIERQHYDDAWGALGQIDQETLFPAQKAWIQACRSRMPPPPPPVKGMDSQPSAQDNQSGAPH